MFSAKEETKQVIEAVGFKKIGTNIAGLKQLMEKIPEKKGLIALQGIGKLAGIIGVGVRSIQGIR